MPSRFVRCAETIIWCCVSTRENADKSRSGGFRRKLEHRLVHLNIWTLAKSGHEHLPVIVWIYGGGYINGSASMPLYWGDRLARKAVVVVTIAYRLGPLGFLAYPELTHESPHHSSGNYGLMDQIAALSNAANVISFFKKLTIFYPCPASLVFRALRRTRYLRQ